jgi:uncharacterized protein (TIGR02271 family)
MALVKLDDYYPGYRDADSEVEDIKGFDVYAQGDDKVGSVTDILVDENTGRLRYLVVDTGFWVFGKKVLLPVGLANISYTNNRINVKGLTKEQVENLPNFDDLEKLDYDYEEQVRGVYRPAATSTSSTSTTSASTTAATTAATAGMTSASGYDRNTYNYEQDASLYNFKDDDVTDDAQTLRLYEERLIAGKQRQKAGEVAIGKHVETETARVAVPVEKERVVIERTNPTTTTPTNPSQAFREGEVARMEIYEERPDIRKEAVVREEVRVKKVVEQDRADVTDTVRREELDIDAEGRPITDKRV